jgi:hypothetical protein
MIRGIITSIGERLERNFIPEPNSGCWIWTGFIYPNGYANFNAKRGRGGYAHRASFEWYKYILPSGAVLDHLCRNRCCINPDHLEIVTHKENQHRSPIANATKEYCPKGHLYDEVNTCVYFKNGKFRSRICRTCAREKAREIRAYS